MPLVFTLGINSNSLPLRYRDAFMRNSRGSAKVIKQTDQLHGVPFLCVLLPSISGSPLKKIGKFAWTLSRLSGNLLALLL